MYQCIRSYYACYMQWNLFIHLIFIYLFIFIVFFLLRCSALIPPAITILVSVSMSAFAFLLNPSTTYTLPPSLAVILLTIYESVPIFLVSSVSSLDSTCEWNHMLFFSVWLILLSIMFSLSIHTLTKGKIVFFLWPSHIPLCKCSTVALSTHLLMDIWSGSISWWL